MRATSSEAAVSYAFEQLEPSAPPPRDAAERALAQAHVEAEQVLEQARAEGRAAGHADGLADVAAAAQALGEALAGVEALRAETVESVERDAVQLALDLAGKILAGALHARPELVIDVVQGALRRVSDRRGIAVLVNPADLQTLQDAIGDLQARVAGIELCDLQSDQRVEPGGAIVRTTEGELDAGVHTQLERAREVLAAALEGDESASDAGEPAIVAGERPPERGESA